ncbi:MAG: AraC family transcriptional regulator [Prevotella sp.]|nr:AraC family transcriptional regulator [Prevotella sp.]
MNKGRQIRKITYREIREIVTGVGDGNAEKFRVSKDLAVSLGIGSMFKSIMQHDSVPLMIEDTRLGYIERGEIDVTVNLINYKLKAGTLAYIGHGSIVQINKVSDDLILKGIVTTDDFLGLALHGNIPKAFMGQERHFYLSIADREASVISGILKIIYDVIAWENHSREMLYGMVSALFHYYADLRNDTKLFMEKRRSRDREIFDDFIMHVNADNGRGHSVGHYAGKMCLSERYLGSVVSKTSGTSVKEWIDKAVVTKAKVMLRHTDMPVGRISDALGFANDSFFCKFFRRMTGITPMRYRRG